MGLPRLSRRNSTASSSKPVAASRSNPVVLSSISTAALTTRSCAKRTWTKIARPSHGWGTGASYMNTADIANIATCHGIRLCGNRRLTVVSAITAATDGAGHVREIALDANHRMWLHNGSSWEPGSTQIHSISTATNAQGNVDIFAVDEEHHAWFRILSQNGQLSNWYQLFPDDVAVASLSAVT